MAAIMMTLSPGPVTAHCLGTRVTPVSAYAQVVVAANKLSSSKVLILEDPAVQMAALSPPTPQNGNGHGRFVHHTWATVLGRGLGDALVV